MLGVVVAGGVIGVALRELLLLPFATGPTADSGSLAVPVATMVVNVVGSIALGVVVGWLGERHPTARGFLGTGVLGGFTTYSAFAVQTVGMPSIWLGAGLAAATVVFGVVGAVLGLFVGRRIADVPGEIEPPEAAE